MTKAEIWETDCPEVERAARRCGWAGPTRGSIKSSVSSPSEDFKNPFDVSELGRDPLLQQLGLQLLASERRDWERLDKLFPKGSNRSSTVYGQYGATNVSRHNPIQLDLVKVNRGINSIAPRPSVSKTVVPVLAPWSATEYQDDINSVARDVANTAANAIGNAVEIIKDNVVDQGLQPAKDIAKEHTTDKLIEKLKDKFDLPSSSEEEPPAYSVGEEYKNQAENSADQVKGLNPMMRIFQEMIDRIGQKSGQMLDNPNAKVGGNNDSSGYRSGPAPGRNEGYRASSPSSPGVQPIQWPSPPTTSPPDPFQNLPADLKTPTPADPGPGLLFGKLLKNLGRPTPSPTPTPKTEPVDFLGNPSKKP